jgi:hypothetical protein
MLAAALAISIHLPVLPAQVFKTSDVTGYYDRKRPRGKRK